MLTETYLTITCTVHTILLIARCTHNPLCAELALTLDSVFMSMVTNKTVQFNLNTTNFPQLYQQESVAAKQVCVCVCVCVHVCACVCSFTCAGYYVTLYEFLPICHNFKGHIPFWYTCTNLYMYVVCMSTQFLCDFPSRPQVLHCFCFVLSLFR